MTHPLDIVLLVLDTQRRERLSCYGAERETTPQLDRLAAEGTRFERAFSTAQWTVPSHASMFTGRYPMAHATTQSNSVLPTSVPTLAERLRGGGYFAAAFCNNPLVGVVNNGLRRGFQSFLNYSGLMTSRPNQAGVHPNPIDRYRQFFKRNLSELLGRIQDAFARSDLLLRLSWTPIMAPLWQTALSFKGNTARSLSDAAKLLVERRGLSAHQPVFAFINLMECHTPYHPQPHWLERYAPDVLRSKAARNYIRRFNHDVFGWLSPLEGTIDAERRALLHGVYTAETANQDDLVGQFVERLRAAGRLDRTLLIVCADHGEHLGEKQLMGHSIAAYNELLHVPLIIRDPAGDLPGGTLRSDVVSTRRIFQTALQAAGLASGEEERYTLARGPASDPDAGTIFAESATPQNVLNLLTRRRPELIRERRVAEQRRVVISDGFKLITTGNDGQELFDLMADPQETSELSAVFPERVEQMQQQLEAYVNRSAALAPTAGQHRDEDNPEVQKRLRDLGYLE
jgi:arylsulfatase A-like enzyme